MATVKCKNQISVKGEKRPCGKFLAILPPTVVLALKDNPQDKLVLRCHDCPGETKWIDVYYDVKNGLTWGIHDEEIEFESGDELSFDTVDRSTIGG